MTISEWFWQFFTQFNHPWFLLLFALLPLIWILSYDSLAGLGRWRRILALTLRTAVFSLLVLSLAQFQWKQTTDRLTVIYLLDQSDSIPAAKREFMAEYAYRAVKEHRRVAKEDLAGVITFGGNAKIEAAPHDDDLPLIGRLETSEYLNSGQTSLESALKLAKASFPEDTARRVVIVSDGNQNVGDAVALAAAMADDGIGIDVVPVNLIAESEVSVDKVVLPTDIRKGQEFEARVVLTNDTRKSDSNPDGTVTGRLRVMQKSSQNEQQVAEEVVTLQPGKNIRGFSLKIDRADVFTFDAVFVPNEKNQDLIPQNNQASAFTHVRGKGRVLLIEDASYRGEFTHLIEKLQANAIEVDVMPSNDLYTSMAELLQYDSIILANLPRATGDTVQSSQSFTDEQIEMLVKNCEELSCGLVMIGGDRSFGAGGWSNSALEKAMPVDFQIKNKKVDAVGALALMMHAGEMADGNLWQTRICREAIKILGPMDYVGVVAWGDMTGAPRWLWKLPPNNTGVDRVFQNRQRMMGMVGRMTPGDMPDFNAPMRLALNGLKGVNASMKHMIIISDGDPTPPTNKLLKGFVDNKIKISTVACGTHMNQNNPLKKIANVTGGKYYMVRNARALPKIFQREARRVARPVIKESVAGMSVVATGETDLHEMMQGIDTNELPLFLGYVMTTVKKNMLVEQLALSSDPSDDGENSTLLATWRYGNGRATVFTSDAGYKWTAGWLESDLYSKLFVQMVRHSMRPITESANFTVASDVKDNKARIVVTALDEKDEFINFLELAGRGVGPDMKGFDLEFNQVGPGRYVAERDIDQSGNFLFGIMPGEGYERLTAGVNIPYSTEYSDRETNLALLDSLVQFKPRGGESGMIIDGELTNAGLSELMVVNTFRPTLSHALSFDDIWPWLLMLCGVTFFADVFIRRVAIDFSFVGRGFGQIKSYLSGNTDEKIQSKMARLQSRKAEIEKEIESRRATTKFAPEIDEQKMSGRQRLEEVIGSEIDKTPERLQKIERDKSLDVEEDNSYTSRLLDAKRKAQKKQNRRDGENDR